MKKRNEDEEGHEGDDVIQVIAELARLNGSETETVREWLGQRRSSRHQKSMGYCPRIWQGGNGP